MGRNKQFDRDVVLRSALKIFWQKGYSETSLQDLEGATGVNKSGLYSEFTNKLELFLSSLRFYYQNRGARILLAKRPLGLSNVRKFLEIAETGMDGETGCFAVNTMREMHILPPDAVLLIEESQRALRQLITQNIQAARPEADANALSELTLTFFSGLCIEQNLPRDSKEARRKIRRFMKVLQQV